MSRFRRRLMMAGGEKKTIIAIPVIEHISNQTLKVGDIVIYNGAGGATVKVPKGTSVIILATAATEYDAVVQSPVTAESNFSTADKITVRRVWTFNVTLIRTIGQSVNINISGAALPSAEQPILINYTCTAGGSGGTSSSGTRTLKSVTMYVAVHSDNGTATRGISARLESDTAGIIKATTINVYGSPTSATLNGTIYQKI